MQGEPPDLLELTRRCYAWLNRGDYDAVTGALGHDSVCDLSRWGLGTHVGPRAIRRFLEDRLGSLESYEVPLDELLDCGHGIVFTLSGLVAAASPSGRLRTQSAAVFVWEERMIERVTLFPDVDEARNIVGQAD